MWKLISVLFVLPLLVSPTTASDRNPRNLLTIGRTLLDKNKLIPEIPMHSIFVSLWSQSKMGNFTCPKVGNYPFPNSCNHFVKCVAVLGRHYRFVFKCQEDRVFSVKNENCILRNSSDREECRGDAKSVTEPDDVKAGADLTEEDKQELLDMERNLMISSENGACLEEGFYGVKTNCSRFYRCVLFGHFFTRFDFVCSPGTVWDDDLKTCNFVNAVKRKACKGVPDFKLPTYDSNLVYYHNFQLTEDQGVFVCETSIRRHPKYCNMLYQCFDDALVPSIYQVYCLPGTWFDEEKFQCVNTPPPSDCTMVEDKELLTLYGNITNTEPLCPPGVPNTPRSFDNCTTRFIHCTMNEQGDRVAFLEYCVGGIFDQTRLLCVDKSEKPECA